MKLARKPGVTSEIWQVFIQDSSSATGAGLAGLAFGTSGLTAYFHRDTDTTATAITLVDMTVGTFTSGGFKEIDATHMPGWYQFCPPNTSLAVSAKSCGFHLQGATNMAPLPIEVDLNGQIAEATLVDTLTTYTGNTVQTGDSFVRLGAPAGASISADIAEVEAETDGIAAIPTTSPPANWSSLLISGAGHISNVDTLTTYTSNTPQTGDSFVRLGAPVGASISADIAEVEAETDDIAAIKVKTDFLPSFVAGAAGGVFIAGVNASTTVDFTGSLSGTIGGFTAPALAEFFTLNTTKVYADAIAGSVVKETVLGAVASSLTAAGVRAAIGLASANLDAQLAEIEGETDDIAAIKAKTDQMVFTVPNQLDANMIDKTGVILGATGLAAIVPTEPTGAPVWATTDFVGWVAWTGAQHANKRLTTDGLDTLRNAADAADIATATIADNGVTTTRGKYVG